jgi:hypothetical protein
VIWDPKSEYDRGWWHGYLACLAMGLLVAALRGFIEGVYEALVK